METYTQSEFARLTGVTRQAVSRAIKDGRLRTVRDHGRVLVLAPDGFEEPLPDAEISPTIEGPVQSGGVLLAFPFAAGSDPRTLRVLELFASVASGERVVTSPVYSATLKYLQVQFPNHFDPPKNRVRTVSPAEYREMIEEFFMGEDDDVATKEPSDKLV